MLFAIATGALLVCWILSFLACAAKARVLRRVLRIVVTVTAAVILAAVLAFYGSLEDAAGTFDSQGRPLCSHAAAFDAGSCELGPGSVFAVIAVGLTMICAVVGWLLPGSGPGARGQRRVRLKKIAQLSERDRKAQQAETRRQRREEARAEAERRRLAALSAADALSDEEDEAAAAAAASTPAGARRRPPPQAAQVTPERQARAAQKAKAGKAGKRGGNKRRPQPPPAAADADGTSQSTSDSRQRRRRRQKPMRIKYEERMMEQYDVADSPWEDDASGPTEETAAQTAAAAQARLAAAEPAVMAPPPLQRSSAQSLPSAHMWWDAAGQELSDAENFASGGAPQRRAIHGMPYERIDEVMPVTQHPAAAGSAPSNDGGSEATWVPAPPPLQAPPVTPGNHSVQYEAIDDVLETIALEEDREAEALFLAGQRRSAGNGVEDMHYEFSAPGDAGGALGGRRSSGAVRVVPPKQRSRDPASDGPYGAPLLSFPPPQSR